MKRRPRPPRTRINDKIRCPEIRVIYGEHNVVLPTWKALNKAKELGLDLVEIAPHAKPPVCRIVDYGKFKYFALMERVKDDLAGMAHVDLEPKLNNRNILMMVSPLPAEKQRRKFRKDGEIVDLAEADAAMEAYDDDDDEDEDYDGEDGVDTDDASEEESE